MLEAKQLLKYMEQGTKELLTQGRFDNGQSFRPIQHEALVAYDAFLNNPDISVEVILIFQQELERRPGLPA